MMFAKGIHWDAYNDSALRAAAECHFVFSFFFSLATFRLFKGIASQFVKYLLSEEKRDISTSVC